MKIESDYSKLRIFKCRIENEIELIQPIQHMLFYEMSLNGEK